MKHVVLALAAAVSLAAAGCSHDGRALRPPRPDQTLSIVTTSTAPPTTPVPVSGSDVPTSGGDGPESGFAVSLPFADGQEIPQRYTCKGADIAPQVNWSDPPPEAVELAFTVVDLDSDPSGFVHWAIAGLDPATPGIAEGKVPAGAAQALDGFGAVGYKGPCPPDGSHTYLFTVYALGEPSGVTDGAPADEVLQVINEKRIASAAIAGVYPP